MTDIDDRWRTPPFIAIRNEILSTARPVLHWDRPSNHDMPWPSDLRGIDLRGERIENASLFFWEMAGAKLAGMTLSRCYVCFDGASPSLEQVTFEHCFAGLFHPLNVQATGLRSSHGLYTSASFRGATLIGATFDHDDWSSTVFTDADLTGARFTACNLHGARIYGSNLTDVTFEDCNLRSAEFRDVVLRGARLLRCDLRYATLEGVDLADVDLTGSRLSQPGEHPPNPYLAR